MKELKIRDTIIKYDPFYPQVIKMNVIGNTGYVELKHNNNKLNLHEIIDLFGGDLLGYKILYLYNIICVYARGTDTIYIIDKKNLIFIKKVKLKENIIPKKLFFKNKYYYLNFINSAEKLNLEIFEKKNIYFILFYYKSFFIVFIIFFFACLYIYFLN